MYTYLPQHFLDYRFRKKHSKSFEAAALATHNYQIMHGHEPHRNTLPSAWPSDPGPGEQGSGGAEAVGPHAPGRGAPCRHSKCFTLLHLQQNLGQACDPHFARVGVGPRSPLWWVVTGF